MQESLHEIFFTDQTGSRYFDSKLQHWGVCFNTVKQGLPFSKDLV
jgi:hypothetical protein